MSTFFRVLPFACACVLFAVSCEKSSDPAGGGTTTSATSGGASASGASGGTTQASGGSAGSDMLLPEGGATASRLVTGPNGETLLVLEDPGDTAETSGTFSDPEYGYSGYWSKFNDETVGGQHELAFDPSDRDAFATHTYGAGFTLWGAGIGLNFDVPIDASEFLGLAFWIKLGGGAHQVRLSVTSVLEQPPSAGGSCDELLGACGDKFGSSMKRLDGTWTFVKVTWAELEQLGWGQRFEAYDPTTLGGIELGVLQNFPFDFWVDDVALIVADPSPAKVDAPPSTPGGYHVVGNQVLTGDGTPYLFHGAHRPSLEWSELGDNQSKEDFELIKSWGANTVRMGLNQAFWLRSPGYKETVEKTVRWAQSAGLDVILDLHWSDRGEDGDAAQQRMADVNSLIFWEELAEIYKGDQRVLFELYNEPHHITWEVWRDGGDTGDGFTAVGMQDMYDVVRATGAENLIILTGIDYAFDLSGVPGHEVSGYNIMYASHPYDTKERLQPIWPSAFGFLAQDYPMILSEFGLIDVWGVAPGTCNNVAYVKDVIDYANQLNMSWVGYAWYPEPNLSRPCSFPSLINDWTGTPSPLGQLVKDELAALP